MVKPAPARRRSQPTNLAPPRGRSRAGVRLRLISPVICLVVIVGAALAGGLIAYGSMGGEAGSLVATPLATNPAGGESTDLKPVLTIPGPHQSFGSIDGSGWAERQVRAYADLASAAGAPISAVHGQRDEIEQDTPQQRADKQSRTQAAQAARQQAERGEIRQQDPSAPLTGLPSSGPAEALGRSGHSPKAVSAGGDVARLLQKHLRRVGCDPGKLNGEWNSDSRRALEAFNRHAGTDLEVKMASRDALNLVRSRAGRICPLVCGRGYQAKDARCIAIGSPSSRPSTRHNDREPAGRLLANDLSGPDPLPGAHSPRERW